MSQTLKVVVMPLQEVVVGAGVGAEDGAEDGGKGEVHKGFVKCSHHFH